MSGKDVHEIVMFAGGSKKRKCVELKAKHSLKREGESDSDVPDFPVKKRRRVK